MGANLPLNRIELLLKHRNLLDSLKIQVQLVLPKPLDLVVTHQQHYQLHQEFVDLYVLLHALELLCGFLFVALETAPEACENALLACV